MSHPATNRQWRFSASAAETYLMVVMEGGCLTHISQPGILLVTAAVVYRIKAYLSPSGGMGTSSTESKTMC